MCLKEGPYGVKKLDAKGGERFQHRAADHTTDKAIKRFMKGILRDPDELFRVGG